MAYNQNLFTLKKDVQKWEVWGENNSIKTKKRFRRTMIYSNILPSRIICLVIVVKITNIFIIINMLINFEQPFDKT